MKRDEVRWIEMKSPIRRKFVTVGKIWCSEIANKKYFTIEICSWSKPTEICRQFVNIAFDGEILVLKLWTCCCGTSMDLRGPRGTYGMNWGGWGGPDGVDWDLRASRGWRGTWGGQVAPWSGRGVTWGGQGGTWGGREVTWGCQGGPEVVERWPEGVSKGPEGVRRRPVGVEGGAEGDLRA